MKRIRINLTGVGNVIVEPQGNKKEDSVPRCNNGLTMEQYVDLNIPYDKIPQELKDREKALDNEYEEIEVEEVYSDVIVYEDEIKAIIENNDDDGYTTIFLRDGLLITVLESALEIDSYLDFVHMSWWDKKMIVFKSFFRRKRNKKVDIVLES